MKYLSKEESHYKQLSFLKPSVEELEARIEKVQNTSDVTRKGIFARHAELKRMYDDLKWEFELLKTAICKGK